MNKKVKSYIKLIQDSLTDELLKPEYRKLENRHQTTGHCYIAAEALYHLLGGKEKVSSYTGRDSDNGTHWWLVDKQTKEIYDPTAEQYYHENENPPYENGKACGFLTRQPSKRCQTILDKVNEKLKRKNKKRVKI
tara:strand:+ start:15677 stop:16081 length:405 start_codon:yes stop_codon:yes gene_type:complete